MHISSPLLSSGYHSVTQANTEPKQFVRPVTVLFSATSPAFVFPTIDAIDARLTGPDLGAALIRAKRQLTGLGYRLMRYPEEGASDPNVNGWSLSKINKLIASAKLVPLHIYRKIDVTSGIYIVPSNNPTDAPSMRHLKGEIIQIGKRRVSLNNAAGLGGDDYNPGSVVLEHIFPLSEFRTKQQLANLHNVLLHEIGHTWDAIYDYKLSDSEPFQTCYAASKSGDKRSKFPWLDDYYDQTIKEAFAQSFTYYFYPGARTLLPKPIIAYFDTITQPGYTPPREKFLGIF